MTIQDLLLRRRAIAKQSGGGGILPSGYIQLEYIQGTGDKQLDLFAVQNGDTFLIDVIDENIPYSANKLLFGMSSSNGYYVAIMRDTNAWRLSTSSLTNALPSERNVLSISLSGNKLHLESKGESLSSGNLAISGKSWQLFGVDNNFYIQSKVYGLKMYRNNELYMDFIPCKRKNDDAIGFYDIVNDTFYEY